MPMRRLGHIPVFPEHPEWFITLVDGRFHSFDEQRFHAYGFLHILTLDERDHNPFHRGDRVVSKVSHMLSTSFTSFAKYLIMVQSAHIMTFDSVMPV